MNNVSVSPLPRITSHEELQAERARLTLLILHQKNIIRQDIDEIREEIAEKLQPLAHAASFVKKVSSRETRGSTLLQAGSTILIEVLVRKLFSRSNLFVQLLVPNLVKNYSTHLLFSLMKTLSQKSENGQHLPQLRHNDQS